MAKPLIIINFSVPPEVRKDFTRFYHGEFLPKIAESNSADVSNIRRYTDRHDENSVFWDKKQYLTIYQLAGPDSAKKANDIFQGAAVEKVVTRFREFKDKHLRNFQRTLFVPTWEHPRQQRDVFSGPFLLWQLEIKPALDPDYQKWYQQEFLPAEMAGHPSLTRCHKYATKVGDNYKHLTVLEADETSTLNHYAEVFSEAKMKHNDEWEQRIAAVKSSKMECFNPIFRWPD
jgi:hypothetical protein